MPTLAVLPVKRFTSAKQRLADGLAPWARETLAEAMVRDVLTALGRVQGLGGVVVVTGEPRVKAPALAAGADLLGDEHEAGQSPAASAGVQRAAELGAERVLLVPGDCPVMEAREVDELLSSPPRGPSVTIVPDRHGTGTNALLLDPPEVIAPAFGEGSFERHRAAAQLADAVVDVQQPASLVLDVDTQGDLDALRSVLVTRSGPRLRTDDVLDAIARRPQPA